MFYRPPIGEIRSTQINLDRQRRELADIDQAVEQMIESSKVGSGADKEYLGKELRRLLNDRRDLDRRKLIVPNKNFITGELINWSLSDKILRIIIPVGIAYGSNTALAGELLLKVARQSPEVLSEPEPSALFLGFGDNSLNFELRIFIDDPMKRFRVSHQIHTAIDEEFRRAGIVIAFPQRDVHLDQIGRLEVNVVSDRVTPAPNPAKPEMNIED